MKKESYFASKVGFIFLNTVLVASFSLSSVHADGLPEGKSWKTRIELSYVKASGNTDTQTLAGNLGISKLDDVNRYYLNGSILQAESDGEETSNKVSLNGRWERTFSERFFGLLSAGYSRDKFSGFDYRVFGGPGIGYDLIKTDIHKLQWLLSLLYYHDKFSVGDEGSDSYQTGKVSAKYEWQIQENVKLKETLDYFVSLKDTAKSFVDSETSVEVKVNQSISIGVSYTINYQNKPPSPDLKNSDVTFLTKLIFDF